MLTAKENKDFDRIKREECEYCKNSRKCAIKSAFCSEIAGAQKYDIELARKMVDGSHCKHYTGERML